MCMSLYQIDVEAAALFMMAAVALLGSPGPGIAALVVAGRTLGVSGGMRLFCGMQLGLALAAGLCVAGLASLLLAIPAARLVLTVASTAYLVWLAWQIASAPVGDGTIGAQSGARFTVGGGFLLGFANPKAFLAFLSLFASFAVVGNDPPTDGLVKWALCVGVMVVVDFAWLALGAGLGRIRLGPRGERTMNWTMGGAVLLAALLTLG